MNYTIRQDAIELLERVTNAPDLASKMNLNDELRERYLSLATQTQMLAESNERWAKQNNEMQTRIGQNLKSMLDADSELYQDPHFQRIAELVEFSMDAEFTVTINLSYAVIVTAPRGTSTSEVENAIEWSRNPSFKLDNFSDWELRGSDDDHFSYTVSAELDN